MPTATFYIPAVGCLIGLLCLWKAMHSNHRRRLLQDTPTSKTSGVFIGFVELKGTAESAAPLTSYLAQVPCVMYQWDVSEHWSRTVTEHYTDSQGNSRTRTRHESGWTTVASGGQCDAFYLKDEEGVILVRPDGAKREMGSVFAETCGISSPLYYGMGPAGAVANSDHRRRFTETAIVLHQPVYVCGHARLRDDVVAPEIVSDRDAPLFVISVRSEDEICDSYAWSIYGWWVFGLLVFAGAWAVSASAGGRGGGSELWAGPAMIAGAAYAGLTAVGWIWMVFDSLVRLRQRVRQGWSLIDVQLKRRHDLIPSLVAVVKAYGDYESEVQTAVADLRAQYVRLGDGGDIGEGLQSCSASLVALAERYPDLKADQTFLKLQAELAGTENRIALARGYFNEIATYYNSRIQVVPEKVVAGMVGMKPHHLMVGDEFSREPVQVDLKE